MTQKSNSKLFVALVVIFSCMSALRAETGKNISDGKPCKAFSSLESNGWSVNKLTDGEKGGKGWSSKAFALYPDHSLYPEYIVVDLGTSCDIDKISLFPRGDGEMAGKGFPENFSIQVCLQGEPWKVIEQKKGYPILTNGNAQTFILKNTKGRYVKIEATRLRLVDTSRYYFQLSEIEVFGKEVKNTPLEVAVNSEKKAVNSINNLRCENEENPIGMDVQHPRLSWWIASSERDITQSAYQILVASSEELLKKGEGDVWNSGKVESDNSIAVQYDGKPLQSGKQYWWKVKVITNNGKDFGWSKQASFATGKLNQSDWQGKWIGANADTKHGAVYMRKEIEIKKPVKCAMVYFCGLGFSELSIDGQKVGSSIVTPGFTSYNKRTQYMAYDVSKELSKQGRKALAITLVDGWYGQGYGHNFEKNIYVDKPKLLFNLHIEYKDGTESTILSNESWKWSLGEITYSHIIREDIDLRKSHPGWDKAGYNDNDWELVKVVKGTEGILVRQKEPPCKIIEEIHPVSMTYDVAKNTYHFEFGREVAGTVHFRTKGKTGTTITITPISSAPATVPIGSVSNSSCKFVLAGSGDDEIYEPRFYNIAINKVEIAGVTQAPKLADVTVCIISSGWNKAGSFTCSDGLINSLEDIVRRTSAYYTTFLPNEPTREWKAWTQDIVTMFVPNTYLFDAQRMYERWQLDMINDQKEDGNVPNVCPGAYFDDYNSPWWGGCIVWLPWNLYQYYGDESFLKESYPAMKRYVDFLSSMSKEGLQDWGLSDWCPIEETPRRIINTPAYYYYATIVSKTAEMMGNTEDVKKYSELAQRIKIAFNENFLDNATGIYSESGWKVTPGYPLSVLNGVVPHKIWWSGNTVCTQAGQILPLSLGLVPEKMIPLVEKALLSEIEAHGNHLSTGFCSTTYLLKFLVDFAPEIGWEMTTIQDYPSWYSNTIGSDNYLMKEMWHGGQVFMPSLAGNIGGWIYQSLGGIRPDSPGFKKIIIKPNMVGDLHWINSSYNSIYGTIVSNWKKRGNQVIMNISIPCNTTATVYVPSKSRFKITESGKPTDQVKEVKFLRMESNAAVYTVVSGSYSFQSNY